MTSSRTRLCNLARSFAGAGVLMLALWLTTAIASPAQTFTTLAAFDGHNGRAPQAALVQGRDGDMYGTAFLGGHDGDGTVFKITPTGTLDRLHSFDGKDGATPFAGLVLATD